LSAGDYVANVVLHQDSLCVDGFSKSIYHHLAPHSSQ